MAKRELLLGDEALALGALHAGLSGVYAYPGTPSTEITEYIQGHPLTAQRGIHCTWSANEKTAMEEALGMSFAEVERRGIMMPILEVQSKYRKPAYFDELLTVRIILREMPSTRINFFYEIYNERGDLLNTGMTQLGFIHSDSRRPCRCPEWFLELIRSRWTE